MLNYMRQNAGSRFIKILLAAIAASFIIGFGFLPSLSRNGDRVSYAAMVNDETVSAEELQHAYRNLYNAFRDQFGEKFDPKQLEQFNLPQMALDQLVVRRLKLAEADRLGIQVSDEQVRAAIREIPAFQQGGRFNKDIYVRLLQYNRTSPSEFETAEREELKISLVEDLVRAGAQITPQEARAKYLEENDQIVLAYLEFSADAFEDQVSRPDDAALRAYLGTHADPFRTKRQVRVNYVSFPFSAFGPPPPTEDEVKARYEQDIAKYRNEEQVRARHILIKISDGDEAKARTLAESIVKRLRAGESFEKLAEKYSEDPGSKTRGGDLGFFPRGRMVPAFEEAAFALKVGEISEPIKSDFGFHVIRVEERKPGGTTPLAEVHDEIAKAIVRDRADAATRQAAEDFQKKASVGDAFTPPAGAVAGKTGFVTLGDDVEGIGRNYLFTSTASRMQANEVSKPIRVGEGYLVLRAEEVREPAVPPFEEIADKVAESYRKDKARDLARNAADKALEALRANGADLDAVAAELKTEVKKTEPFPGKGPYIPGLGAAQALKTEALTLSADQPLVDAPYDVRGNWVVAKLAERVTPSDEEAARALPGFTKQLLERRRADIVRDWTETLRRNAEIRYNDALLERLAS